MARDITIEFRVSQEEKGALEARAAEKGLKLSAWIRNKLDEPDLTNVPMSQFKKAEEALRANNVPEPEGGYIVNPSGGYHGGPIPKNAKPPKGGSAIQKGKKSFVPRLKP